MKKHISSSFNFCTSKRDNVYSEMVNRMVELATKQDGFLGIESAREEVGITVSY